MRWDFNADVQFVCTHELKYQNLQYTMTHVTSTYRFDGFFEDRDGPLSITQPVTALDEYTEAYLIHL